MTIGFSFCYSGATNRKKEDKTVEKEDKDTQTKDLFAKLKAFLVGGTKDQACQTSNELNTDSYFS
jgi:hypothetical protein